MRTITTIAWSLLLASGLFVQSATALASTKDVPISPDRLADEPSAQSLPIEARGNLPAIHRTAGRRAHIKQRRATQHLRRQIQAAQEREREPAQTEAGTARPSPDDVEEELPEPPTTIEQRSKAGDSGLLAGLNNIVTGQGTFFTPDLGACGVRNSPSDHIVAVSHELFDSFGTSDSNDNVSVVCPHSRGAVYPRKLQSDPTIVLYWRALKPVCNKKIKAIYQGKSAIVTVTDRCTGCSKWDLDFTKSGFAQLADLSAGRISGIKWAWLDGEPGGKRSGSSEKHSSSSASSSSSS